MGEGSPAGSVGRKTDEMARTSHFRAKLWVLAHDSKGGHGDQAGF